MVMNARTIRLSIDEMPALDERAPQQPGVEPPAESGCNRDAEMRKQAELAEPEEQRDRARAYSRTG